VVGNAGEGHDMTEMLVDRATQTSNTAGAAHAGDHATYDLAISTLRRHDELLVRIVGQLDAHTDGLLVGCCRSWVYDGVRDVVVDLSGLKGMDGHGLASLLRCRRVLRAHAGTLRVVHPPTEVAATMTRAGMYVR
jgi:anti-sigma B factor antagonist